MSTERSTHSAPPHAQVHADKPGHTASEWPERRRVARDVPKPEAVELDDATGWDLWDQSSTPA